MRTLCSRIVEQRQTPVGCHPRLRRLILAMLATLFVGLPTSASDRMLKVSDNRRFLCEADGRPFFYLGDTAWELFHRLTREEADLYLRDRASKGFTVIQAVALAEFDGLGTPNAYGRLPLIDNDPTRPDIKDGPRNDYWDHVDDVINQAESLGLFVGLLPTWGDKWNKKWGQGPEIFSPENAETYGRWLGSRYKTKPIIWILGGDRPVETDRQRETIRALARGVRQGDGGRGLITFHPTGGQGSATEFHGDEWLDFNMRQNGHVAEFTGRYDATRSDYDRTPIKPVLDAEPIYEGHPVSFNAKLLGHSIASDVRRPLYWDLFSGACGHTYGHHAVWQFFDPERRPPVNNPLAHWKRAIDDPGAGQMQIARWLLESRPYLSRIPDQDVIVASEAPTSVPGAGRYQFVATRDEQGSYAMVYAPVGRAFKVRMNKISGAQVNAWWYSPRDGKATHVGVFSNEGEREFSPPDLGEMIDWVLVLDAAAQRFPPPGAR